MMGRTSLLCLLSTLLLGSVWVTPVRADSMRVVTTGQTLYKLSKETGCTVKQLEHANSLESARIYAGQELSIPDCSGKPKKKGKGGDDDDVVAVYGGVGGSTRIKAVKGQSVGAPWDGTLVGGVKLPTGKGYYIRRPQRAYGTTVEVMQIQRAIKAVRKRFPKVHTLAIGDLSAKHGGDIDSHHSHESGRDVDIGFYFKKKPEGYPESFVDYDGADLDLAATWALLYAFTRTSDQANGVEKIFLDTKVQKKLYEWAKSHGVPEDYLDKVFQCANSDGSGIVRYEPNHQNHMHVRFKCPASDGGCEQ
jgi:murein endopeptidase